MPKSVVVGDLVLRLTAETEDALRLWAAAFRTTESGADADRELRLAPGSLTLPGRAPDLVQQHVRTWHEDDATWVATSGDQLARIGDTVTVDARDRAGLHLLVLPVLAQVLAPLVVVHAGSYLDEDGAVLVLGDSGQGKSTTIAAALADGRPVLSDDLTVVRPDSLQVCGVPMPLALPGDLTAGEPIPGDHRGRRSAEHPPVEGWHQLVGTLLPGHGVEPALTPAAGRDVLHAFLRNTLEGSDQQTVTRVFGTATAVSRKPGWHLLHGADPSTRLRTTAELLRERAASTARARQGTS